MFDDIIGHSSAISTLLNAHRDNRLAGSYLFVGPPGVGKSTVALRFAALLCGATSPDDRIARAIQAGSFPDVRVVSPPESSPTISIAQIWPRAGHATHRPENALLRDLYFEPMSGPKRVFLILEAEGLGKGEADSGNSILKSLEEPPHYAEFILTASSTASLLPTILSRCQVVRFSPVSTEMLASAIAVRYGLDLHRARFIAEYAEGRPGRAFALASEPGLLAARELFLDFMRGFTRAEPIQSFKLTEEFRKLAPKLKVSGDTDSSGEEKGGREALCRALDQMAVYYRDILAAHLHPGQSNHLLNEDRHTEIAESAKRSSVGSLETSVRLIVDIRKAVERNANAQVAIDVLFLNLLSLAK